MMKEIKTIDERETLVYGDGNAVLEISTDNPTDGKDGFCFVITPNNAPRESGVAIGLPFEEVKKTLRNNDTFELHSTAFGIIPLILTMSIQEENGVKNIKITTKDEMELAVFEEEFKLPSEETEPIIDFCKKFM